MPGHHDAGNEYTSLEDAQNAALYAKEEGLGGKYQIQLWSFNPIHTGDPSPYSAL